MRFFSALLVLLIVLFSGNVFAQTDLGGSMSQLFTPPPPPVDEYYGVPPGMLMSGEPHPADDSTAEANEEDIMTIGDLIAAYNKGQYDLVAKHIIPIANGNYPQAEEMLGIMYHKGQGVPDDPQSAIEWLTKAAEAGRPLAQHYLATLTYAGDGVPADPVRALMWLYIAIVHYPDGPDKDRAVQDRNNLSSQLSRRDRMRAFDLAHDWLKKRDESALLGQAEAP